ncbi:hypothetical protein [Streptomyces sp. NPDC050704]|uniref:RNA polymerase sigma factor n=1 Tax=Streptomyces sp. NPDC050704 TaxID=3157219 RepID=UPI00341F9AF3
MTPDPFRQQADHQLLTVLAACGFAGPRYARFSEELARYGISVLQAWLYTGRIFAATAKYGFPLHPTDAERAELARDSELRQDLANMTVAQTLPRFRDEALIRGGWQPDGGLSLTSYFVGACVYLFPNEYRRHRTAQRQWNQASAAAKDRSSSLCDGAETSPFLGRRTVEEELRSLEPRTREIVALHLQSYTHQEIAETLDEPSAKAVEGVLYRWRQQVKRSGKEERDV